MFLCLVVKNECNWFIKTQIILYRFCATLYSMKEEQTKYIESIFAIHVWCYQSDSCDLTSRHRQPIFEAFDGPSEVRRHFFVKLFIGSLIIPQVKNKIWV